MSFVVFKGQQCFLASNGTRPLPPFERPSDDEFRFTINPIQAIITSYRFNCCGVVTGWRAFVEKSRHNTSGIHSISFQVWRPNTNVSGCYYLVDDNSFLTNSQDFDEATRGLISASPSLSERIEVQPGDVVGFNYMSRQSGKDGILFSDNDSYREESVWFETGQGVETNQTICPVGRFTNLAPLITVTVGEATSHANSIPAMYNLLIHAHTQSSRSYNLCSSHQLQ